MILMRAIQDFDEGYPKKKRLHNDAHHSHVYSLDFNTHGIVPNQTVLSFIIFKNL